MIKLCEIVVFVCRAGGEDSSVPIGGNKIPFVDLSMREQTGCVVVVGGAVNSRANITTKTRTVCQL